MNPLPNESLTKLTQLKDIILTAQEAKRYVDGINAAIDARLQGLQAALDALVGSDDTTAVIDTFNEVIAFLNGIEGTTLDALLSALRQSVSVLAETKQDVITDLPAIRSGAAAGATAYQKPGTGIPKSDMTTSVQQSLSAADTAYQKPSTGISKTDMSSGVQGSLEAADSADEALSAAKGSFDSLAARLAAMDETDAQKYVKPSSGIPSTDLSEAAQGSLAKAEAAAPQSNTYTKHETDTLLLDKLEFETDNDPASLFE